MQYKENLVAYLVIKVGKQIKYETFKDWIKRPISRLIYLVLGLDLEYASELVGAKLH